MSILLYGCTTGTLTKRMEKELDSNYSRMLWAILNKSWRQHPTKHQLYGHLSPITKTIMQDIVGEIGKSSLGMYPCGHLQMDEQRQDDQLEPTYSCAVSIQDVTLKTCRKQWTIGRGGERGSGISVLMARRDDDDDDDRYKFKNKKNNIYIYIYIHLFFEG